MDNNEKFLIQRKNQFITLQVKMDCPLMQVGLHTAS